MENKTRILLVDDDQELCALLGEYLQHEGFSVSARHTGEQALSDLQKSLEADLIVLDIMMPGISGLEVLQQLRPQNKIPVIMLTGRGDDIDRILGLEMGADDYLAKPCNPRELVARIRAILRRSQAIPQAATELPEKNVLQIANITLNTSEMLAMVNDTPLTLTAAEFNTLRIFVAHPGETLTKQQLTQQILHRELTAYDRSIDVHVSRVRQKLAAAGVHDLIRSVRGVGYQLLAERNS
ncbi:two-component system OmpR family response regulator/two-component system response regulator CpxR [Alteromonadaceae bacterium 2753L.S.0a.02]|nr:two-component system OmpR family response regulator/two-component system response regulator CpxR [Alteromonadaceae bacterium 2753L.S.0a.02]